MEMNMTNGFNFTNSTATFEPSVDGLIALTVIIWVYLFSGLAELWFLIFIGRNSDDWADNFPLVIGCRRKYRSTSPYAPLITGIIVTGMIVTPLTLVVGGVLSPRNGDYNQTHLTSGTYNETFELSANGFTGRVLLIVSAVVQLVVWTVAFAAAAHGILGCRVVCGCASALACVFGTVFVVDVALLGMTSLGVDAVQQTNGFFSTAPGTSVIELIVFAGVSWCATLPAPVVIWYICEGNYEDTITSARIAILVAVVIGIPPLSLVAGSVLSLLNDDSLGLSAEGITGRVLLIFTGVISILVWVAIFTAAAWRQFEDKCKSFCAMTPGYVITAVFVIGVALLGQTSFEIDTVPMNGTNSTVTNEIRTAGVVISSLGLVLPFLVSVVLAAIGCIACVAGCMEALYCVTDVKEWMEERRQETRETLDTRLKKSKSLLEEALKHGFKECRTVVCLLVGVAGAGKTHTKHLLFRKDPPKVRGSTPLAVRPVQAIRVRKEGEQLQEVEPDQLDQMVAGTVAQGGVHLERNSFFQCLVACFYKTTSAGISAPSQQPLSTSTTTEISPIASTPRSYGATERPSNEPSFYERKCCYCCPFGHSHDSDSEQIAKAALDKTIHEIANTSKSHLLSGDWIYLIDSGGQIEFLEVLPAFLQHISVCLFVTKLCEMLSECPKIEYFENGEPVSEPMLCPFTNEQMLMRCVQTIDDSSTNQGSKLVMVGTHRDDAHKCRESIQEKNQQLENILCPDFERSLVFHGHEIIFPINAKNPCSQDHEVASEITKVIFKVVSDLKPRKTPISWFKFEQIIQKLARDHEIRILHLNECLKVARLLHLSKKDLDAALDHLASFGVIHYYPHLLPDVVFVDPQFILDKISEVVKFHFKLRHDPTPHIAIGGEWRKFINEGFITLELLRKEQFSTHYTNFFTAYDFLKLMKDRLIVTDLIGQDEYFMPCLLRTMESQEVDQYRVTASGVAPLAIHFSCKLVPHGVFCSLVAFLRSSQNSSPWKLFPHPENSTEPQCLTRNCIKFKSPNDAPGSLTLIDAFSHFEVHVNTQCDICVNLCPSIWQTLAEGIQKAAETLKYQLVPKQAFLCKHNNTRPHLALLAKEPLNYWTCELNSDISGPLEEQHNVWLPNEGMPATNAETPAGSGVPSDVDEGVKTWAKKIKEKCSCKFVMFIIAVLGLVVSIVGIIVPVLTTRHVQPHQNSSDLAISD